MSGRPEPAVRAEGLTKSYGRVRALDGVDLEVPVGTVTGLLGPNGAGKTTIVRILATLLRPDAGRAEVAGFDVLRQPHEVRQVIGLAGQSATVDEILTGRENLELVGRLYGLGKADAGRRADELLERFDLTEVAGRQVRTYSGGLRRRVDLAASLVGHPRVLFLDEPTTGLDPRSRVDLWELIRKLVKEGTTLLLTTQYLEEADRLADRITVIDGGRIIAEGTAAELKTRVGGDVVEVQVSDRRRTNRAAKLVAPVAKGTVQSDPASGRLSVPLGGDGAPLVAEVVRLLDAGGLRISDLQLRRPTLDDVFLVLTGHSAEPVDGDRPDVREAASAGRSRRRVPA